MGQIAGFMGQVQAGMGHIARFMGQVVSGMGHLVGFMGQIGVVMENTIGVVLHDLPLLTVRFIKMPQLKILPTTI
ncbi:hypothetical protein [Bacillus carboniphilus]